MMEYLAFLSRIILIIVLSVAVVGKLRHHHRFRKNLHLSFAIPEPLVKPIFTVLIGIEIALCLGLITGGRFLAISFLVSAVVIALMTTVLGVMLLQNKVFSCACFGEPQHSVNFGDIVRNLVLTGAAITGVLTNATSLNCSELGLLSIIAIPLAYVLINLSEIYPVLTGKEQF